MPSGEKVGHLGQFFEVGVQRPTGSHEVRNRSRHVGKEEELGHGAMLVPAQIRQDATREVSQVLRPRASPGDPGLQEARDLALGLRTVEPHPAGHPFGALSHAEPCPAPVSRLASAVRGEAPRRKGLREHLAKTALLRVVGFRLGARPVRDRPASRGGGPARQTSARVPRARGKEPREGPEEGKGHRHENHAGGPPRVQSKVSGGR